MQVRSEEPRSVGAGIPVSLYKPKRQVEAGTPTKRWSASSNGLISNVKLSSTPTDVKSSTRTSSRPSTSRARPATARSKTERSKSPRGTSTQKSTSHSESRKHRPITARQTNKSPTKKNKGKPNYGKENSRRQKSARSKGSRRPSTASRSVWVPSSELTESKGVSVGELDAEDIGMSDDAEMVLVRIEKHLAKRNERLIDLFRSLDKDRSGDVSSEELRNGLHDRGFSYTESDEAELLHVLDTNGDGVIEYSEMLAARKGLAILYGKRFSSTTLSSSSTSKTAVATTVASPAVPSLSETMQMLTVLDRKLSKTKSDYIPVDIPAPRPQLPVGNNAELSLAVRNAKKIPIWLQNTRNEPVDEQTEARLKKRERAKVVDSWIAKKDKEKDAERRAQLIKYGKRDAMIDSFVSRREQMSSEHFKNWCEKKKKQQKSPMKERKKASIFTGKVHIDEFIAALRRYTSISSVLLYLFESLLPKLDPKGRVPMTKFYNILDQVDLELRIMSEHKAAQDRKQYWESIPPQDLTKEQRLQKQREGLLQRIGDTIVSKNAVSRRAAVKFLSRISEAVAGCEEANPGKICEPDLKNIVKDLNLGISSTQQVDLCKACLDSNKPPMVNVNALEDFVFRALGQTRMHTAAPPTSPEFNAMMELCNYQGLHEVRILFEDIHIECVSYRDSVNDNESGWVDTKKLLAALLDNHEGDDLPLGVCKDLVAVIGRYCKLIDRDSDGVVESSRILVFLRMVHKRLIKQDEAQVVPREERRRSETRHRLFKTILEAQARLKIQYPTVLRRLTDGLAMASFVNGDRAMMTVPSFVMAMRRLELGLSTVQIEDLARVCASTNGVYPDEVQKWIAECYDREQTLRQVKSDPRTALCDEMIRVIGPTLRHHLPTVLEIYRMALLTWDNYSSNLTSKLSAPEPTAAPEIEHGNEFDITWGRDDEGMPIVMPPGAVEAREDIDMVKKTPGSKLEGISSSLNQPQWRRASLTLVGRGSLSMGSDASGI